MDFGWWEEILWFIYLYFRNIVEPGSLAKIWSWTTLKSVLCPEDLLILAVWIDRCKLQWKITQFGDMKGEQHCKKSSNSPYSTWINPTALRTLMLCLNIVLLQPANWGVCLQQRHFRKNSRGRKKKNLILVPVCSVPGSKPPPELSHTKPFPHSPCLCKAAVPQLSGDKWEIIAQS